MSSRIENIPIDMHECMIFLHYRNHRNQLTTPNRIHKLNRGGTYDPQSDRRSGLLGYQSSLKIQLLVDLFTTIYYTLYYSLFTHPHPLDTILTSAMEYEYTSHRCAMNFISSCVSQRLHDMRPCVLMSREQYIRCSSYDWSHRCVGAWHLNSVRLSGGNCVCHLWTPNGWTI